MADPSQPNVAALVEQLRAEHEDSRDFVDALIDHFDRNGTTMARNAGPLIEEALRVSREIGYERGEALAMLDLAFVHFLWQRNREALDLALEAKPRLDALGQAGPRARCGAILGGLHNTMGSYQKGLEYLHGTLAILESHEISEWHGWPNYLLGDSYRAAGDLARAREHYAKAYEIFTACEVETGIVRALIGLGSVCRDQGDLEASHAHFTAARKRTETRDDPFSLARTLSDLALVHQLMGNHDKALALFDESLQIRRERCGDLPAATCLIDLGKLLLELDRADEAVKHLNEALELSAGHDHKPRVYLAHEALSEAHARQGDLQKALYHHKEFQRVKEEVMGADNATRLRNLEISLEAAAKEKEAELVLAHNEELQAKNTELARLLKDLRDTQEMLIQSEKMASLGQLTAGIAHEIQNPLNFVNNFSAITRELAQELTQEIEEHRDEAVSAIETEILELASDITANADRILEHGRRAGQIVNSMLVHSRKSGGKKSEVDVNQLVSTSVDLAYHGFVATNGDFELAIEKTLADDAGMFTVIEDEVARVLTNILSNAFYAVREYTETMGAGFEPRIRVQTARQNGIVEMTISDNGPGIDDERKMKVFEPFYTTKPTGSGTGLGLSQSYEIITERHGGTLRVVDTEGGGATFVIAVPG